MSKPKRWPVGLHEPMGPDFDYSQPFPSEPEYAPEPQSTPVCIRCMLSGADLTGDCFAGRCGCVICLRGSEEAERLDAEYVGDEDDEDDEDVEDDVRLEPEKAKCDVYLCEWQHDGSEGIFEARTAHFHATGHTVTISYRSVRNEIAS